MKAKWYMNIVLALFLITCTQPQQTSNNYQVVCNPIDISYRFQLQGESRREAADPTVVIFQGDYFLFASKSGGYWHSPDLVKWDYVKTNEIPVEGYAPTAVVMRDTIFFIASDQDNCPIYKSGDPKSGKWQLVRDDFPYAVTDPAFFLDNDGRLYFYWGCSNHLPIMGIELDPLTFDPIGSPDSLLAAQTNIIGWENPGDYNQLTSQAPWLEGAWVNRINNKYYLQYSGPGTEYKSYADAIYVADSPLGPYTLASHNPFAYKPEGFACGAGHGSSFFDKYGNLWHMGTVTISQKHIFERRLALFPAFLDKDSVMHADTRFGDYPFYIPNYKVENKEQIFPDWMLLSYNKQVSVSSSIDSLPPQNMTDEDIRTYWSAQSGNANEWAMLDLGEVLDIYAVQVNFAEHETYLFDRVEGISHKYEIWQSVDNSHWEILIDQTSNNTDNSHCFHPLDSVAKARYLKVSNIEVPAGHFALSGFRVFGKGTGDKPQSIGNEQAVRGPGDRKTVNVKWDKSDSATGYNIRFGHSKDKMYLNYQVMGDTSVTIRSLHAKKPYVFAIEAFNENGVSGLSPITSLD
jgi:xylan 1,4-beta-xylosidase